MKCVRLIILEIVVTLCMVFLLTSKSMATTAIVDTDTLKLRKEASTDSTVLELLNLGEKLNVIEQSGDWVKVKVNGMTGFVHKDYVKIEEEEREEPIMQQPQEEKPEKTETENENSNLQQNNNEVTEQNQGSTINEVVEQNQESTIEEGTEQSKEFTIREATLKTNADVFILPLINTIKIGNLSKNQDILIMDEVNGWFYIQTEEISGWVRQETINDETNTQTPATNNENTNPEVQGNEGTSNTETPNGELTNGEEPNEDQTNTIQETPIEEKVMYVNYSSIYVRKGPSTDTDVVDTLILNNGVTVIAEVEDWYKVKIGDTTGYIAKRLLSNTQQQDTSRSAEERTEETTNEQSGERQETISNNISKGQEIVNYAKQYLGCKYVYGGSGPSTFDCSGFTMYVYAHFGISLSHSAIAQSKNGTYVSKQDLQPGDLVFFKDYETMDGIGHCGIYIGDGNFIHASSGTGYCVKISTLLSGSYDNRYETARRLI